MKRHELTSSKIGRLFKLLDYHNRKNIQLIDFEAALGKHTSGKKSRRGKKADIYWIKIAIDKIGDFVSKNHKDASESFYCNSTLSLLILLAISDQ